MRTAKLEKAKAAHLAFVRVIVRKDVTSLEQLTGKPVSFGLRGKSGEVAGRATFEKLGIKVQETPLDIDNALDGIASGDVGAAVVVDPRDVAKVQTLKTADLHLLEIPLGRKPPVGMKVANLSPSQTPMLHQHGAVRTFALEESLLPHLARRQLAAISQ